MLDDLSTMLDQCRMYQSTDGLSIVVSTDGAVALLREVFFKKNSKITFTDDPDELFIYDDVPVKLRVRSAPGIAVLAKTIDIPPRGCCDITACTTIALTMSWRQS